GEFRIVGEKAGVVQLEHAGAGAGGRHDIVETLEGLDHLAGNRDGALWADAIIGGRAATGLRAGNLDPASAGLDQLDRRKGDARPEQVDKTGDEQADLGRGVQGHFCAFTVSSRVAGDGSQDVALRLRLKETESAE